MWARPAQRGPLRANGRGLLRERSGGQPLLRKNSRNRQGQRDIRVSRRRAAMRDQVESVPRVDASLVRWSGLLDRPWTAGGSPATPEPDAWRVLRAHSESTFCAEAAPWATFRVCASVPQLGRQDGTVFLDVDLIADHAAVFGEPGMAWTTRFVFVAAPTNLGGVRWWLRCPICSRRRAHLYPLAPAVPWICRVCLGLTYKSRQEHGHFSRHGGRWGSVHHALDGALRRLAARARRSYRRAYHRDRASGSRLDSGP